MKVGLIGFGNMGGAVIDGLLNAKALEPENVFVSAKRFERLKERAAKRGIHACASAKEVVSHSDLLFLCPPADVAAEVLKEIAPSLQKKPLVSFVSGFRLEEAETIAPGIHFLSALPSTPIRYGEGIVILEQRHSLEKEEHDLVVSLLSNVALVKEIAPKGKEVASTIAGCGPALGAMFLEALGDAGCEYGLSREDSYALASQMLVGVGKSYLESKRHPGALKDEVASPGGSTIRGIVELEKKGFRGAVISAIEAIEEGE